jgi:lysine-N-methylase
VLVLSEARYRCTSCGDCCRGWDVPLQPGEAAKFLAQGEQLVSVERLRGAVGSGRHAGVTVDTLAATGRCAMLTDDNLCRIHGRFGEAEKPRACRIFPFTFVATPAGVRVGLSWACPAVVDGEGPPLGEQRAEIDALFKSAVDGTRYLLSVGDEVLLGGERRLPWAEAEQLLAAFPTGGPLLSKLCGAGALSALVQVAMEEGRPFASALEDARARAPSLVTEALAAPPDIDRLSRAMFRTLLSTTQPRASAWTRLSQSLFGGGKIVLRGGGEVALSAVEKVARGLDGEGEALVSRWVDGALAGLTFFGDAAFGLSIGGGLDFLALAAAVTVFLARAQAAANGRTRADLSGVRAALRQVDAGLSHRSSMPPGFARALDATASLDLLREQLSPGGSLPSL